MFFKNSFENLREETLLWKAWDNCRIYVGMTEKLQWIRGYAILRSEGPIREKKEQHPW